VGAFWILAYYAGFLWIFSVCFPGFCGFAVFCWFVGFGILWVICGIVDTEVLSLLCICGFRVFRLVRILLVFGFDFCGFVWLMVMMSWLILGCGSGGFWFCGMFYF